MNKVKKLHLPLWQDLVYLALLIIGPVATIYSAAIIHNPQTKYISYLTIFFLGTILLIVLHKTIIVPWRIKVQAKIATLELNYSTSVGNEDEIKTLWCRLQFLSFLWRGGVIFFATIAIYFLISGLTGWIDKIGMYLKIMLLFVMVALLFRALCYLGNPFKKDETSDTTETTKE